MFYDISWACSAIVKRSGRLKDRNDNDQTHYVMSSALDNEYFNFRRPCACLRWFEYIWISFLCWLWVSARCASANLNMLNVRCVTDLNWCGYAHFPNEKQIKWSPNHLYRCTDAHARTRTSFPTFIYLLVYSRLRHSSGNSSKRKIKIKSFIYVFRFR